MAGDILPIQLSLTDGDQVTLWAPRWREDGAEWEAFLGGSGALFAFPSVPALAAFVRTAAGHDLVDHPAWPEVRDLTVVELTPVRRRCYDIVGVPELAAREVADWTVGELARITDMVRSIAEVCGLGTVTAVLDGTPGFGLLRQGTPPFTGRKGRRLWTQLMETVADRWDEVVDAIDDLVVTPDVDPAALPAVDEEPAFEDDRRDPEQFWGAVGIDPIRITCRDGEFITLRCYLDEQPVFLGSDGRIDVFGSERGLTRWLAGDGAGGHDLARVSTWPQVAARAAAGELEVVVGELNDYVLLRLDRDLGQGTLDVDPTTMELAAELLLDAGAWAGDDEPRAALSAAQPLGRLVSFVTRPDPASPAPEPPFTAEAAQLRELIDRLTRRFRQH